MQTSPESLAQSPGGQADSPEIKESPEAKELREGSPIGLISLSKTENSTTDADTTAITNDDSGKKDTEDPILDISPSTHQAGQNDRDLSEVSEPDWQTNLQDFPDCYERMV